MGWFSQAIDSFNSGADSATLQEKINRFFEMKSQFVHAYNQVGRDINRFPNYQEPFAIMQKLIFEVIDLLEKYRKSNGVVDSSFVNIAIKTKKFPRTTIGGALEEMFFDIDDLNKFVGYQLLKKWR